jgi:TPR repeat protein
MRNPLQQLGDTMASRNPKQALVRAKALLQQGEPARAVKLLEVAALADIAEAQHEMGMRYLTGEGLPRNPLEAARWFSRAADKGFLESQCHLASLHLFGLPARALQSRALQGGSDLFAQAEKPEADYDAAMLWARRAADGGSADAQAMLAYILTAGPKNLRDAEAAELWYQRAALAGSPQGHLGYGLALMRKAESSEATVAAIGKVAERALLFGRGV